jgi:hypothetical protein
LSHLHRLLDALPPRVLHGPLALLRTLPMRLRCRRRRPYRTSSTGAPPPWRGTAAPPALVTSMSPCCCGESPSSSSCLTPPRYYLRAPFAGRAAPRCPTRRRTSCHRWRAARDDQLRRMHGAPREPAGQAALAMGWATPSRPPRPFGP